jgi:subtilase family serine protease
VLTIRRTAAALSILALAACAQSNALGPAGFTPSPASAHAQHRGMHPNEGGSALPGEGGSALPGAQLPCSLSAAQGQASCTIAINVNIPPLSDATAPSSMIPGLHPSDLANAYALPVGNAGETVAVVDAYDDPTAESDLATYRAAFGLPACAGSTGCFQKVNEQGQAGSYPAANAAWSQEIALDLEMISAVCPNCSIVLVEANSASVDDLGASVDAAVALGAKAVGNSYYAAEWAGETAEDPHYHHAGVAITASAGDQASPFYPAASPYVLAVGGTTLRGSAGSWNETAWQYGGNGCSQYEKRPSFQNGVPCSTRAIADVAAVADPQTGVAVFSTQSGGWVVAGGTSVGAPLLAGAYALAANAHGPGFSYAHRSAFHDVAPAGYDLPTGLGSPNGVAGL